MNIALGLLWPPHPKNEPLNIKVGQGRGKKPKFFTVVATFYEIGLSSISPEKKHKYTSIEYVKNLLI